MKTKMDLGKYKDVELSVEVDYAQPKIGHLHLVDTGDVIRFSFDKLYRDNFPDEHPTLSVIEAVNLAKSRIDKYEEINNKIARGISELKYELDAKGVVIDKF